MLELLKRESLIHRVAVVLEAAIRRGEWRRVPSERRLCVQLHVSRLTLERALDLLKKKGLIRSLPRVGYEICMAQTRVVRPKSKAIRILLRRAYECLPSWFQLVYGEVDRILLREGFELCFYSMMTLKSTTSSRRLARLVQQEQAACWVIHSVPRETQLWFMMHHIPTLVIGHCFPGVRLPAIDTDNRAICRHAVTHLMRLGHRHIALLIPRQRLAGDRFSEQGFREGINEAPPSDVRGDIWHYNLTAESVRRLIRKRWSKPGYPTALIVSHPYCAITAAGGLMQCGLRLGKDVSLICQESDETLAWATPPIASYVLSREAFARRIAHLLVRLAQTGRITAGALMLPRLMPEGTLGPAPSH